MTCTLLSTKLIISSNYFACVMIKRSREKQDHLCVMMMLLVRQCKTFFCSSSAEKLWNPKVTKDNWKSTQQFSRRVPCQFSCWNANLNFDTIKLARWNTWAKKVENVFSICLCDLSQHHQMAKMEQRANFCVETDLLLFTFVKLPQQSQNMKHIQTPLTRAGNSFLIT